MIVLAAHGTRDPAGPVVIEALADGVRSALPGETVCVAYADVRSPSVADVLSRHPGERVVVVPAFLSAGYHVRTDIPRQIVASGHPRTVLADAFGPAPELIAVLIERLVANGYRHGDGVILAAAGSSDHRALIDVHDVAYALGVRLGAPVRVGYAATARPSVPDAVAALRATRPDARVAVASWLLAPGLFQRRLDDAGADVAANPLGAHPRVVDLIVRRYQAAVGALAAA
ncbi:sirohydrochlorin chelatase [Haloechinothrix salitolerans]|uniref:Sirohydrochlorin chelatase n=1 Tax=Haloechinothrix salitolerans TaxID=926830 RepID=A0ABW2C6U8_9PSEU